MTDKGDNRDTRHNRFDLLTLPTKDHCVNSTVSPTLFFFRLLHFAFSTLVRAFFTAPRAGMTARKICRNRQKRQRRVKNSTGAKRNVAVAFRYNTRSLQKYMSFEGIFDRTAQVFLRGSNTIPGTQYTYLAFLPHNTQRQHTLSYEIPRCFSSQRGECKWQAPAICIYGNISTISFQSHHVRCGWPPRLGHNRSRSHPRGCVCCVLHRRHGISRRWVVILPCPLIMGCILAMQTCERTHCVRCDSWGGDRSINRKTSNSHQLLLVLREGLEAVDMSCQNTNRIMASTRCGPEDASAIKPSVSSCKYVASGKARKRTVHQKYRPITKCIHMINTW